MNASPLFLHNSEQSSSLCIILYNSDERNFSILSIRTSIASSFAPLKLHCKFRSRHSSSSSCIINALDVILRSSNMHASKNCQRPMLSKGKTDKMNKIFILYLDFGLQYLNYYFQLHHCRPQ